MARTPLERSPEGRTFHHSRFSAPQVAAERDLGVTVCLPARECAATIGPIVETLLDLREQEVLDEVLVVDADSRDGTAERARRAGATVRQETELLPEHGPVMGKGDAMWRALSVIETEVVCFLDADTEDLRPHFATGLIGALCCEPEVWFAKAFYRRPLDAPGGHDRDAGDDRDAGGRVNRLTARPALALLYPDLAWIRQPLAGEVAARREMLEEVPFATGYGVEIAMLLDVWRNHGVEGIAQVDLDEHRHRHQPLSALEPMAATVLATIARRLTDEGRLQSEGELGAPLERPPLASLTVA
jgi:glucosyl-3-phosphoglycerate synthase